MDITHYDLARRPSGAVVASAEASTLGLAPGEWPDEVTFEGVVFDQREPHWDSDGDLRWVDYANTAGLIRIFND